MMLSQSAIEMAPPFSLVSKFFIAATLFLGGVMSAMPFLGFYLDTPMIAMQTAGFIHLYLLGFVMMIIIGALYQLVPVVLEVPFSTLKGSSVLFVLYTLGTLSLSLGMMNNVTMMMHLGGGLVYVSLFYFSLTFLFSFRAVTRWTLVSAYLLSAGVMLLGAISLGMALLLVMTGSGLDTDVMYLLTRHATLALGGFVMLIVMGVSLVLLPMFALAHNFTNIWAKLALGCMLLGMTIGIVTSYDDLMWICIGLGLLGYLIQVLHIFQCRVRKQNDYWVGNLMASFIFLAAALVIGAMGYMNENERLIKSAFFFTIIGFGFHFVMGHMYKILPFLIWYKYISPLVGKQKVPMLHEMIKNRAAYAQMWLGIVGTVCLGSSIITTNTLFAGVGGALLGLSSWAALYNVWYAYGFKNKGLNK